MGWFWASPENKKYIKIKLKIRPQDSLYRKKSPARFLNKKITIQNQLPPPQASAYKFGCAFLHARAAAIIFPGEQYKFTRRILEPVLNALVATRGGSRWGFCALFALHWSCLFD